MFFSYIQTFGSALFTCIFSKSDDEKLVDTLTPSHFKLHAFSAKNPKLYTCMSFENDAVRALIHTLKYQGYPPAILYVADNLTPVLEKMVHDQPALQIVPIPSSKKRQRSRGYNQIMLVLNECARQLPSLRSHISQNALTRQKDTKPQTSLQRAERLKNMHDAFVCDARTVSGAHLLIIDDVYTTGATMHAAIEACQAAGAASVRGLVFSSKHY